MRVVQVGHEDVVQQTRAAQCGPGRHGRDYERLMSHASAPSMPR
jgi:hypothetical protein